MKSLKYIFTVMLAFTLICNILPVNGLRVRAEEDNELLNDCLKVIERGNILAVVITTQYVENENEVCYMQELEKEGYLSAGNHLPTENHQDAEEWKELILHSFDTDFLHLSDCLYMNEHGKLDFKRYNAYETACARPIMQDARIVEQTEAQITISFPVNIGRTQVMIQPGHTVTLSKSDAGYKIVGGTYFQSIFGAESNYTHPDARTEFEECITALCEAELFTFFFSDVYGYYHDQPVSYFCKEWLTEQGYLPKGELNAFYPDQYRILFPLGDRLQSIEKIKTEYNRYFEDERYFTGMTQHSLEEVNGILYSKANDWRVVEVDYKSFQIVSKEGNVYHCTVNTYHPTGSTPNKESVTIKRTDNGMRIVESSYFKNIIGEFPPQTGEDTPILLTISLLSLAVLTGTVSFQYGKEKRRFKL